MKKSDRKKTAALFRKAIKRTNKGEHACIAISHLKEKEIGSYDTEVAERIVFSDIFKLSWSVNGWAFEDTSKTDCTDEYKPGTPLGKMTRAIALELAAYLVETGEF